MGRRSAKSGSRRARRARSRPSSDPTYRSRNGPSVRSDWVDEQTLLGFPICHLQQLGGPLIGYGLGRHKNVASTKVNEKQVLKIYNLDGVIVWLDKDIITSLNHLATVLCDMFDICRTRQVMFLGSGGSGVKETSTIQSPFTNEDHESHIETQFLEWMDNNPESTEDEEEDKFVELRAEADEQAIAKKHLTLRSIENLQFVDSITVVDKESEAWITPDILFKLTTASQHMIQLRVKSPKSTYYYKKNLPRSTKFASFEVEVRPALEDNVDFLPIPISARDQDFHAEQAHVYLFKLIRPGIKRNAISFNPGTKYEIRCRFKFRVRNVGIKASNWKHFTMTVPGGDDARKGSCVVSVANSRAPSKQQKETSQPSPDVSSEGSVGSVESSIENAFSDSIDDAPLCPVGVSAEDREAVHAVQGVRSPQICPSTGATDRAMFSQAQVTSWLTINCDSLEQYAEIFFENGYDSLSRCGKIERTDLLEMNVKKGHIRSIMDAVQEVPAILSAVEGTSDDRSGQEQKVCVLTGSPYKTPVRAADGHIYERMAIETWLSAHDRSPLTNVPLQSKNLVAVEWSNSEWRNVGDTVMQAITALDVQPRSVNI